jgi:hypothetical protein
MVTSIARLAIYYAVMVAPIYIYNPMKIPQIWPQSDWKLMIFHSGCDSDGLGRENEKGLTYVLMRPPPYGSFSNFQDHVNSKKTIFENFGGYRNFRNYGNFWKLEVIEIWKFRKLPYFSK